jgi:hypothetical protein
MPMDFWSLVAQSIFEFKKPWILFEIYLDLQHFNIKNNLDL